jgi:hypothetical protein
LRQAVENGIRDDGERAKLMQHIAEMEKSAGGSNSSKLPGFHGNSGEPHVRYWPISSRFDELLG